MSIRQVAAQLGLAQVSLNGGSQPVNAAGKGAGRLNFLGRRAFLQALAACAWAIAVTLYRIKTLLSCLLVRTGER